MQHGNTVEFGSSVFALLGCIVCLHPGSTLGSSTVVGTLQGAILLSRKKKKKTILNLVPVQMNGAPENKFSKMSHQKPKNR